MQQGNGNSIVDLSVFSSVRFQIGCENLTSRTRIADSDHISILEFHEKALVLSLPPRSCNREHSLLLTISQTGPASGAPFVFEATAKAHEVEVLEDASLRVFVELLQFDEVGWQKLLSLYSARQEEITGFLQAVKG